MILEDELGIKKPATEETLQSIDCTLKRIADIMEREHGISHLQRMEESFKACSSSAASMTFAERSATDRGVRR